MSFETYKRLVDEFGRHLVSLDLSMWGDPLIAGEIYRMVRYAHDRGIWTYLSSNLHAFRPEKGQARQLVESGLDVLTCSLHGATQESFEAYQPGKRLEVIVERVRALIQTRDQMGSKTPAVQLNFVVTRQNEQEQEAFSKLAQELGCKAVFSTPAMNTRFLSKDKQLVDLGLPQDVLKEKVQSHLRAWLPSDPRQVLEPYQRMLRGEMDDSQWNGKKLLDCSWPWRAAVVNWDGTMVTCCGAFDAKEDLGNLNQQSFAAIWNGPKYRRARRSFKRKLSQEEADGVSCANCPGFML